MLRPSVVQVGVARGKGFRPCILPLHKLHDSSPNNGGGTVRKRLRADMLESR